MVQTIIRPKVSVVLPVYNGSKYLRLAIDSVLQQTFTDFELLVINDGSTDDSEDIVKSYQDSRVTLINNESNIKLIKTLNRGVALARGEYIARMDSDDICVPTRLEKQVAFMDSHRKVGMCGTWINVFRDGKNSSYIQRYPTRHEAIKSSLFFGSCIAHPTAFFRRNLFNDYELWYDTRDIHAEDYGLWVRCVELCELANLPEVMLHYRLGTNNITTNHSEQVQNTVLRIQREKYTWLNKYIDENTELIHRITVFPQRITSSETLLAVEKWLSIICALNTQEGFFDNEEFLVVIGHKWFEVAYAARAIGMQTWRQYWESVHAKHAVIDRYSILKFFGKCLLKLS